MSASDVQGYVRRGGEVTLTTPIPVHVTYFTVAVDERGNLQTFADVYGLDNRVALALEGPAPNQVASQEATPRKPLQAASRTRSRSAPTGKPAANSNPLTAIFWN
jgi:hypothetical protein